MADKAIAEIYEEQHDMESNALNGATQIHQSIEQACENKYVQGRKEHGPAWVGKRGALEAYDEIIDALVYIGLERQALFHGFDPDEDQMSKAMKARADVIDKLIDDLRGSLLGLKMFIEMTETNNWKRIFP